MTTGSSSATFPGIPALQSPRSKMTPSKTSRKASAENMNDLLNFSLPPRQNRQISSIPRRSRRTGNVHGVWNKERFLNAQYRFVMNPHGDYTVHFADPDIYFQWQDILQIIVPRPAHIDGGDTSTSDVSGLTSCPICLSSPTAPRMTKCGHVFCFPCILHYLSTSDNKWARCPICFDSVHASQLKCVKWYEGPPNSEADNILEITPSAGTSLRMRLIQRPHMTTLALPRSHTWPSDLLSPHQAPFHFLPDVLSFAKFMLATPQYLIGELTKELDRLAEEKRVMGLMQDELSVYFLGGAEEKVRGQIEKAEGLDTPLLKERIEKATRDNAELLEKADAKLQRTKVQETHQTSDSLAATSVAEPLPPHEIPTEFLASRSIAPISAPARSAENHTPSKPDPRPRDRNNAPRQRRNVNPPPPDASYFYYQAASGLPIFLHPLDIKILLTNFKSYSLFPDEITVRVQASSEGTVNTDLRKRCKYLSHLPESADVIFVEASLEGVVSEVRLKEFEKSLEIREGKRKEKARRDDRAKLKAEEKDKEQEMEALRRFMPSGGGYVSSVSIPIEPPRGEDVRAMVGGLASSFEGGESNTSTSPPGPVSTGAWGNRSFASALHSSSAGGRNRNTDPARRRDLTEDEWDADEMWQELEQRTVNNAGGGKKKRGARMVILGGGGPGLRRR